MPEILHNLSETDRKTLLKLRDSGPGGNFDPVALNTLFTRGLIAIDDNRRVILTADGLDMARKLKELEDTHHD